MDCESMVTSNPNGKSVLIIGGGIAGMQAALDLADQKIKVYLVETLPSIGGRMAQLDKTFPTLDCASCILTPRMVDVARHEKIELLTYSEVQEIAREHGHFVVKILKKPRYVNTETCNGCGICVTKCPKRAPNEFNLGMDERKAIYFLFPQAVPLVPVIDPTACIYFLRGKCRACEKHCPTHSISFDQEPELTEVEVGAIIYATGFSLYDPSKNNDYEYNTFPDVITSLELERLVSSTGPTEGCVIRPSNGEKPRKVAFILCVGSRSQRANYWCSRFCCMASIKQAVLLKEHDPRIECTIFYMDIRAFGKGFQEFYERAKSEFNVRFVKGRVGSIKENSQEGNLLLRYENIETGYVQEESFDLVVLAVGAENPLRKPPSFLELDDDGFIAVMDRYLAPVYTSVEGIFVAGTAEGPKDIPDCVVQASAAAMEASILITGGE